MVSRGKARKQLSRWDRYLSRYPHGEIGWCRITPGWVTAWDRLEAAKGRNADLHLKLYVLAALRGCQAPKGWGVPYRGQQS